MARTSEARKRLEESTAPPFAATTRWSAVLLCDGVAVTGEVPCSEWNAAEVVAPLLVGWLGGPVSIVNGVIGAREPVVEPQGSLFEEVA